MKKPTSLFKALWLWVISTSKLIKECKWLFSEREFKGKMERKQLAESHLRNYFKILAK